MAHLDSGHRKGTLVSVYVAASSALDGHWYDVANPFHYLSSAAGKVVADGWTALMLGLWNAGLMVLKFVLNLVDTFTTPDLSSDGPGHRIYQTTFWIAGALVLVLGMVQLGVAAIRRDGRSLATLALGFGKFAIVCAGWVSYGTAVVAACGGLTRALMGSLLGVGSWAAWEPWGTVSTNDITDGAIATILGLLGALLFLSALAHLLVMLARAGALIVLVAVTPITAAGQLGDLGQSWLWKSLRWFHAAALTPVLMVLVIGIGVQMSTATATAATSAGIPAQVATAIPGVMLILISCAAPLTLFKLLAFVDPSTSSGSAMRAGLAAQGGLQGMLGGKGTTDQGSGAAASTDDNGRTSGEAGAENATGSRFAQGALGGLGGGLGNGLGQAIGAMASIGSRGASIGSDLTNQMSVGHHSYHPDFTGAGDNGANAGNQGDPSGDSNDDARQTPDPAQSQDGSDPSQVLAPTTPSTSNVAGGTGIPGSGGGQSGGQGSGNPLEGGESGGAAASEGGSEAAAAAVAL